MSFILMEVKKIKDAKDPNDKIENEDIYMPHFRVAFKFIHKGS